MEKYKGIAKDILKSVRTDENNPNWEKIIARDIELYKRENEVRTEFERDFTRILFSNAYKRLKHKTQVIFSPKNDHICTRIEHVNHVESISYTIGKELGLNTELIKAIAVAHDIGHGPFGHKGERILNSISKKDIGKSFWHEKNGVFLADYFELLEDPKGNKRNLSLTYGVRDGIISHCGEVDQNSIKPRKEYIDLEKDYNHVAEYEPFTWEGCVVKISDKISYIGRDIEDALDLNILSDKELDELKEILNINDEGYDVLNNTNIIGDLIGDLLNNSSIEKGLSFSKEGLNLMNNIKAFNYKYIYCSPKVIQSDDYFNLVINKIYDTLKSLYNEEEKRVQIKEKERLYGNIIKEFLDWLIQYTDSDIDFETKKDKSQFINKKIFDLTKKEDYYEAIIIYISGMTDNKAIETFNSIISF